MLYSPSLISRRCRARQVTVHFLPAPTFVLLCQLGISSLVVKVCDSLGYLEADKFEWEKVRPCMGKLGYIRAGKRNAWAAWATAGFRVLWSS